MSQRIIQMNVDQPAVLLHDYAAECKVKVVSMEETTEPISILITGKNLVPHKFRSGKLEDDKEFKTVLFKKQLTTAWFPVSRSISEYLVMSGDGYNCALWQFIDQRGEPAKGTIKKKKFTELRNPKTTFHGKTISIAQIPEDAAYARVFFADRTLETKDLLGNRLQIEYGRIPTEYEPYKEQLIKLPSIQTGTEILYENGEWYLQKDKNKRKLRKKAMNLFTGAVLLVQGGSGYEMTMRYEKKGSPKGTRYGIRHRIEDPNPVCERIDDAKGLHFTYTMGNQPVTPYQNDFDQIYPWSKIRLCAVSFSEDGKRKVLYQGEEGFSRDGKAGQVMVEIPKFYTKREVKNGYDSLWISQEKLEGFELDPAFLTAEGSCSHIYIGAYFSSKHGDKVKCVNHTEPMIKRTLKEIRTMIRKTDGGHYKECDLNAILAVQKLFMIEAATLDSQSIFEGVVYIPYLIRNKASTYYARRDAKASNKIILLYSSVTKRFIKGDSVTVLNRWSNFRNTPGEFQRKVLNTKKLDGKFLEITFSGPPVDIITKKTGICCLPRVNGDTDIIKYHTGRRKFADGHSSFKYRHIENLWGNLSVFVEDAYVCNNRLSVLFPDRTEKEVNYDLPVQNSILLPNDFGEPTRMCIKEMGYDPAMPGFMFPSVIGNGASTSSYYCDAWYNIGEKDKKYILTYGGAWDNKAYAGIFDFRAEFTEISRMPFNGSRIMLR